MIKRATGVPHTFGGEAPDGWLPSGAARPLSTPETQVLLDVEIVATGGGFILQWSGPAPEHCGDLWFADLADADAAAADHFGLGATDWAHAV